MLAKSRVEWKTHQELCILRGGWMIKHVPDEATLAFVAVMGGSDFVSRLVQLG